VSTLQDVFDSARAATDQVGSSQVTDSQLLIWAKEDYPALARRVSVFVPDRYTKVTTLTIGAGQTTLQSVPSDFLKPRTVDRVVGTSVWDPVPRVSLPMARMSSTRGYLLRGANTIEIFPATLAPASYVLTYIYKVDPSTLVVGTTLDLPDGCERVLAQQLAARIRVAVEEESMVQFHLSLANGYWLEAKTGLEEMYPDSFEGCIDVNAPPVDIYG
jgi:hypothetical protein